MYLCDISGKMLDLAKGRAGVICGEKDLDMPRFLHGSIQELDLEPGFDLVLCHAVLEWVVAPEALLARLAALVAPGGILSLTFYNLHGMVMKNLLRANYKKILREEYHGWPGSLTPAHPRKPEDVLAWIQDLPGAPLEVLCHSGMRVFHDYNLDPVQNRKDPETVIDLELRFSRELPYRDLGRYQHLLLRGK